jgi:hypothetical protein
MQISIPDEYVKAAALIFEVLGIAALLVIVGVGAYHLIIPVQPPAAVQSALVITPTPTPAAFVPYWTGSLEITGMQTGSGAQIDCANGQSFYVSWQDYYRLRLHEICSFYVTGTTNPYGTVMFTASQVNVVGHGWYGNPYQWNGHRYYQGSNGRYYDSQTGNEVSWKIARDYAP